MTNGTETSDTGPGAGGAAPAAHAQGPALLRADPPWRGPVLGAFDEGAAGLFVAVGCSPGAGLARGVACVPLLGGPGTGPRLPSADGKGVGLADGRKEVTEALRDCVIWVRQRIDSTTPLVRIRIPIDERSRGCSRMLLLLVSILAPRADQPPEEAIGSAKGFAKRLPKARAIVSPEGFWDLYVQTPDVKYRPRIPPESVATPSDFMDQLVECIFERIEPQPWVDLKSGILHLPLPGAATSLPCSAACCDTRIRFFLASCLYPAGLFEGTPHNGSWIPGPADASLCRLAAMVKPATHEQPSPILIMSGDQIYADATAGVFDARLISDRLSFSYERLFRSRGAAEAFTRVLPVMLIDDHEICDNWEPEAPSPPSRSPLDPRVIYSEAGNQAQRNKGVKQYWKQERAAWNPLNRRPALSTLVDVDFRHDGAPFYLLDTRTRRQHRTAATIEKARIVTRGQMRRLRQWLRRTSDSGGPRFIDTPSAFLPRHRVAIPAQCNPTTLVPTSWASALRSDAWDGYPRSQHALLALLVREPFRNVVFLSGDEHVSFVTWAKVTEQSTNASIVLRSIHSSGLYTPYPFANSTPEDLAANETFCFELAGSRFRCEVKTEFFDRGAGFAEVTVTPNASGSWDYHVDFHGEYGRTAYRSTGNNPWV